MKILIAIIALLCLAVAAYGGQYPAKVVTGTITMLSAQTASTYSLGSAASYCDNLTAAPDIVLDGSTDATIYRNLADWTDTIVVRYPVGHTSVFQIFSKSGP